jgi:hypothetical protein
LADAGISQPAATLWSTLDEESSLLAQARAATNSLRALIASEDGVEVETIDATATFAAASPAAAPEEQRDGYCQHLPRPGSRIMEERCFYPTRGEAALNDYQFRAEIEQIREQQALLFMENSEFYEDWVKAGRP